MAYSGKDFEDDLKRSWEESNLDCSLIRLYDTTNGFRGVANPCDFIMGTNHGTMLIECKTTKDTAFSFEGITPTQLNEMLEVSRRTTNTKGGVLIYFRHYGKVLYYTIGEINEMIEQGQKSVNPTKHLAYGREIKVAKKRVRITVDIQDLLNCFQEQYGGIMNEQTQAT